VDATIVVNRLGTVEEVDEGACTLLGYSKGELVGLHGSELIPTEAQPATAASIDRIRLGELPAAQQGLLQCKDGSVLSVEVHVQTCPNDRLAFSIRRR